MKPKNPAQKLLSVLFLVVAFAVYWWRATEVRTGEWNSFADYLGLLMMVGFASLGAAHWIVPLSINLPIHRFLVATIFMIAGIGLLFLSLNVIQMEWVTNLLYPMCYLLMFSGLFSLVPMNEKLESSPS